MTNFILVRHGTAEYGLAEERRLKGGARDWVPLSSIGVTEVNHLVTRLCGRSYNLILTSPTTRALQTAAILSRCLDLPIAVEFDLHEWLPDLTQTYDSTAKAMASAKEMETCFGEWPEGETRAWEPLSSVRNRARGVLQRYNHLETVIVACHGTIIHALTGQTIPCAYSANYQLPAESLQNRGDPRTL